MPAPNRWDGDRTCGLGGWGVPAGWRTSSMEGFAEPIGWYRAHRLCRHRTDGMRTRPAGSASGRAPRGASAGRPSWGRHRMPGFGKCRMPRTRCQTPAVGRFAEPIGSYRAHRLCRHRTDGMGTRPAGSADRVSRTDDGPRRWKDSPNPWVRIEPTGYAGTEPMGWGPNLRARRTGCPGRMADPGSRQVRRTHWLVSSP